MFRRFGIVSTGSSSVSEKVITNEKRDGNVEACADCERLDRSLGIRPHCADAEARRDTQFCRRLQSAEQRLPRGDDLRDGASPRTALFAAAEDRRIEISK